MWVMRASQSGIPSVQQTKPSWYVLPHSATTSFNVTGGRASSPSAKYLHSGHSTQCYFESQPRSCSRYHSTVSILCFYVVNTSIDERLPPRCREKTAAERSMPQVLHQTNSLVHTVIAFAAGEAFSLPLRRQGQNATELLRTGQLQRAHRFFR